VMKEGIRQRAADPFVEEDKHRGDLDALLGEPVRVASTVALDQPVGAEAFAVKADVGCRPTVPDMIAAVVSRFGRLDTLANNAGIQTWKPFLEVTHAESESVVRTNLTAAFSAHRPLPHTCGRVAEERL
jgi:3-oxoacyl-[acyl-carrier protein] reductase